MPEQKLEKPVEIIETKMIVKEDKPVEITKKEEPLVIKKLSEEIIKTPKGRTKITILIIRIN